jgi:hypothetical protein
MPVEKIKLCEGVPDRLDPLLKKAIRGDSNGGGKPTESEFELQMMLNSCFIDALKKLVVDQPDNQNHNRKEFWGHLMRVASEAAVKQNLERPAPGVRLDEQPPYSDPDNFDMPPERTSEIDKFILICNFLQVVTKSVYFPMKTKLLSSGEVNKSLDAIEKLNKRIIQEFRKHDVEVNLFDLLLYAPKGDKKMPNIGAIGALPLKNVLGGIKAALHEKMKLRLAPRSSKRDTAIFRALYEVCNAVFGVQDDPLVVTIAEILCPSDPDDLRQKTQITRFRTR